MKHPVVGKKVRRRDQTERSHRFAEWRPQFPWHTPLQPPSTMLDVPGPPWRMENKVRRALALRVSHNIVDGRVGEGRCDPPLGAATLAIDLGGLAIVWAASDFFFHHRKG